MIGFHVVERGQGVPEPLAGHDAAVGRLLAGLDELEAVSRFDVDGIAERARELAEAAEALQLPHLQFRAELVTAEMLRCGGDVAEAGRLAHRVRRWATEGGEQYLQARSAYVLSAVFQELGDLAEALQLAVQGVDLLGDLPPVRVRMDHRVRLADCLGLHGDATAAEHYAEVLALARDLGDTDRELLILNNWAYSEALAGRFEAALRTGRDLQLCSQRYGLPLSLGRLDTLARALMGLGRYPEAAALLEEGLAPGLLDSSTDGDAGADFLLTFAEVHRSLGQPAEAQQHLDECVRRCERHGLRSIRVRARREQAQLHAATGAWRAAYEEQHRYSEDLADLQSAQRDARALAIHAVYEAAAARRESRHYRELSLRDSLTGLLNRRYVDGHLPRLLQAERERTVTVALADVDHFKRINDTCSHEVGDDVLRRLAQLLEDGVAGEGEDASFVARMGGEEFLVVLVGLDPFDAAARLDALRRAVGSHPWEPLTGGMGVTVSIGAAWADGGTAVAADLVRRADAHLYRAKREGRDRVVTG